MKEKILILPVILFICLIVFSDVITQSAEMDSSYKLSKTEIFSESVKGWLFVEGSIISVGDKQMNWLTTFDQKKIDFEDEYLKTIFSKSANYYAILTLRSDPQKNSPDKILGVEVFTFSGKSIYSLERPQYFDESLPLVLLSDQTGAVIICYNDTGEVWFYDGKGTLIHKIQLFPDAEYDLEKILSVDISEDGSLLAIAAGKRGASPAGSTASNPSAESHLFLFDSSGEEIWREKLPEYNTMSTSISGDANYIAVNSYTISTNGELNKRALVFDKNGGEILETDLLFKYNQFSSDSKFLLIAENSQARMLDLDNEKIVWNYQISPNEGMICDVALSRSGQVSALLIGKNEFRNGEFIFNDATIEVFNASGKLMQNIDLLNQDFYTPALEISADAREIFVGLKNSYQIYRVQ
jgi:hypothetical protein